MFKALIMEDWMGTTSCSLRQRISFPLTRETSTGEVMLLIEFVSKAKISNIISK